VPGLVVDPTDPIAVAVAQARRRYLFLLRHASQCTAEDGRCAAPDCATTKALWTHLRDCTDNQCVVPLCLVSRSLLSHFRRCRGQCAVCDPVKEVVREELGRKTNEPPPQSRPPAGSPPPLANTGGQGTKTVTATAAVSPLVDLAVERHPSSRAEAVQHVASPEEHNGLGTMTTSNGKVLSRMSGRLPLKKRSAKAESWNTPPAEQATMQDYFLTPRPEPPATTIHLLSPPPPPSAKLQRICAVTGGPCLPLIFDARGVDGLARRIASLKPRCGAFRQAAQREQAVQHPARRVTLELTLPIEDEKTG